MLTFLSQPLGTKTRTKGQRDQGQPSGPPIRRHNETSFQKKFLSCPLVEFWLFSKKKFCQKIFKLFADLVTRSKIGEIATCITASPSILREWVDWTKIISGAKEDPRTPDHGPTKKYILGVACHFTASGFSGKVSQQTRKVLQQVKKIHSKLKFHSTHLLLNDRV